MSLSIKDEVTHLMVNYIKYDHLAPKCQAYLSRMTEVTGVTVVLVYIDDVLIVGDSLKRIQHTNTTLQETFKMKDLEELKYS